MPYPDEIETFPAYVKGTPDPAGKVTAIADTLERVQTELGINPSGTSASVADRLATLGGTSALLYIDYTDGAWPLRSTVTSDTNRRVLWFGPATSPAPVGGGYMVEGRDVFMATY